MDTQVIEVENRTGRGKGEARKLRASGKVPAVLYGHKEEARALSLDPRMLQKGIRKSGKGRNTLFEIKGLDREVLGLIKEAQIEPLRRDILHIDFIEVRESDRVNVDIPLEYTGKPAGVTAGGDLEVVRRRLRVEASPLSIPKKITIDITELQIGQVFHVSDITLPDGVTAEAKLALVTVRAPKVEAVAAEEGEEAPEAAAAT